MKTGRLMFLTALVLIVAPALFAAKKTGTLLSAPTIYCTAADEGTGDVLADWDAVTNTNPDTSLKYSVEVDAGYDSDLDGCADTHISFDFPSDGSNTDLTFNIEDLAACILMDGDIECTEDVLPVVVQWKVKALNPPGGKYYNSQNNYWSDWCEVYNVEECLPES